MIVKFTIDKKQTNKDKQATKNYIKKNITELWLISLHHICQNSDNFIDKIQTNKQCPSSKLHANNGFCSRVNTWCWCIMCNQVNKIRNWQETKQITHEVTCKQRILFTCKHMVLVHHVQSSKQNSQLARNKTNHKTINRIWCSGRKNKEITNERKNIVKTC